MITSITIKNVATFDHEGIEIRDLKKINFIYGANGSGKTTISSLINSPALLQNKGGEIIWKNDIPLEVITYNKEFRELHFNKGKIQGVFTLGNATGIQIQERDRLNTELSQTKDEDIQKKNTIDSQNQTRTELQDNFNETCWTIYKENENDFKEAFTGYRGSKKSFADQIIQEYKSNKSALKTFEELQKKAKTIFGDAPQLQNTIFMIDYKQIEEIENNPIWQKKIIGKADVEISKLISRLNINDWVNQGQQFIEADSEVCPFCQNKTITNDFKTQLEKYFDETFIADTKLIRSLCDEYNIWISNIANVLESIENKEKTNSAIKLNIQLFSSYLKTIKSQFQSNKELLNGKVKEPSRDCKLVSTKEQLNLICNLINDANKEIKKHNAIVNNFQNEKTNLITNVWKYLVEKNKNEIETFLRKLNGLEKGINKLEEDRKTVQNKYKNLEKQIKEVNKNITSIQPSIDAINATLLSYGFENFKIVPSKAEANFYQIEREDGSIAEKTLSEGEVTFITFLYFLQLTKGAFSKDSILKERVLVVDDPISSLDSTVLFVVSSLLKEIIKSIIKNENNIIKQLILLTHNVYFHKEVSFFDSRAKQNKDVNFWIIRKCNNLTKIQPFLEKNPIRGSYELLWDELKQKDNLSGVTIQNTMRRIIETYFKTMGKYTDDSLIASFTNKEDQEICRSLICWVNDGSHCMSDDLHIEQQEAINEKFFDVFAKIFKNTNHLEHYNMMMDIKTETT